jgi:hypothetical protein
VFGSSALDVAVGLFFVYFLLAAITSHVAEGLSAVLGWRGKHLLEGLTSMLGEANATVVLAHPAVAGFSTKPRKPSYLAPATFSAVMLALESEKTLTDNPKVAKFLSAMGAGPRATLATRRAAYEAWFNDTMDRVSGVYKRHLMLTTFAIGTVLVVALNADTIAIATTLSQDQALRAALQTAAGATNATTSLEDAVSTMAQFSLPLGWTVVPVTAMLWALKITGLVVSALAVSLGAPFWFGLLQKVTRAAGPKPQTGAGSADASAQVSGQVVDPST